MLQKLLNALAARFPKAQRRKAVLDYFGVKPTGPVLYLPENSKDGHDLALIATPVGRDWFYVWIRPNPDHSFTLMSAHWERAEREPKARVEELLRNPVTIHCPPRG